MVDRSIQTTRTTRTRTDVRLTGRDIREALRLMGHEVPESAAITFDVPGGGNWSNTSIEISREHPISVSWIDESVEQSDG